ncbi:MAG: LPS export ABC transporter periplasmic protein LptC [Bacteroidetes bacterium]|nr:LPS export ABC transporter periplasmic protein LptC [Bacteroidota bacterium]
MINFFSHIYKRAAVLMICCLFLSCENKMSDVEAIGKKRVSREMATQIESYMSQGGIMKAKLTAPLMWRTQTDTPMIEFPKTLRVDFYSDSTKVESRLTAKYGRYYERMGTVFLKDSIVVINLVKKDTLRCDELNWDRNKEIFFTDKKVSIHKSNGDEIHGLGLIAKQDFSQYTILNVQPDTYLSIPDSTMPVNR